MYNVVNTLAPTFSIGSSLFFQVTRTTLKSGQSSNLRQIGPRAAELAALDRIEKIPLTYNRRNLVNTLAPSFLIRSSSFLQVTRTYMKALMSSNLANLQRSYGPCLTSEFSFCSIS